MRSSKRKSMVVLGCALLCGSYSAAKVSSREREIDRQLAPLVKVVIANKDLPANRAIAREDLVERQIPARFAPAGLATSLESIVGQRLLIAVSRGGPIVSGAVMREADPHFIKANERLIEIDAVAPARWVRAGSRVDVVVASEDEAGRARARLAMRDIEIMAVQSPAKDETSENGSMSRVFVTLRVTIRQAMQLASAQAKESQVRLLASGSGLGFDE